MRARTVITPFRTCGTPFVERWSTLESEWDDLQDGRFIYGGHSYDLRNVAGEIRMSTHHPAQLDFHIDQIQAIREGAIEPMGHDAAEVLPQVSIHIGPPARGMVMEMRAEDYLALTQDEEQRLFDVLEAVERDEERRRNTTASQAPHKERIALPPHMSRYVRSGERGAAAAKALRQVNHQTATVRRTPTAAGGPKDTPMAVAAGTHLYVEVLSVAETQRRADAEAAFEAVEAEADYRDLRREASRAHDDWRSARRAEWKPSLSTKGSLIAARQYMQRFSESSETQLGHHEEPQGTHEDLEGQLAKEASSTHRRNLAVPKDFSW